VVHRLESPFGFLSPLITQFTGRPGIKSRAMRVIFAQSFDVVHFHNISLVGGPAVITRSRAPVNLYTLHDHWLLCPTHVFWKNNSKQCDGPTCFRCGDPFRQGRERATPAPCRRDGSIIACWVKAR